MTTKISLMNLKGGVGKSLTTDLVCDELAKMGKKVLLVDLDPQANSTQIMGRSYNLATGHEFTVNKTMMKAIADNDLSSAIVNVLPNLDILPSYIDFYQYPWFAINQCISQARDTNDLHRLVISMLTKLMKPIIESGKYDYILYDVPPTISTYVESAMMNVDYIAVILQTEDPSYDGAKEFLRYAQHFASVYPASHFKFLGMIGVLKKRSPIDNSVLTRAKNYFGNGSLIGVIRWLRRVERYSSQGISDNPKDYHDRKVHDIYKKLTKAIISRVNQGGM